MTVWQFRQENVSNCALCSSDLLLTMANPHSGQCRIGRCGCEDIGSWRAARSVRYLLSGRVCKSAQYKVPAKMPRATAMMRTTIVSVGIAGLRQFSDRILLQVVVVDLILIKIAILNGHELDGGVRQIRHLGWAK